jgi:hypothetical protein
VGADVGTPGTASSSFIIYCSNVETETCTIPESRNTQGDGIFSSHPLLPRTQDNGNVSEADNTFIFVISRVTELYVE